MLNNNYGYACINMQLSYPTNYGTSKVRKISTNRTMIKKTFFYFLLFFITIFSIILLIEILLRFSDKDPWGYFRVDLKEPTTNSYHDILGWEPKPGVYKFKAYSNLVKDDFTMTIIEDGIRYSGKYEKNYNKIVNPKKMIYPE